MKRLIEMPFGSSTILIEISSGAQDIAPIGTKERAVERIEESFEESMKVISKLAAILDETLRETKAQSAEVSLGLKFSGKGRLFLVETSGEGTLNLKLLFSRSK